MITTAMIIILASSPNHESGVDVGGPGGVEAEEAAAAREALLVAAVPAALAWVRSSGGADPAASGGSWENTAGGTFDHILVQVRTSDKWQFVLIVTSHDGVGRESPHG